MASFYVWIGHDINHKKHRGLSLSKKDTPKHLTLTETKKVPVNKYTQKKAMTWLKELLKLLETHSLKEALFLLIESLDLFQACLSETIYTSLSQGRLLSCSLKQWPMLFQKTLCDWIRIGEQCGSLSSLGLEAIENSLNRSRLKKKVIRQLTYPAIILISSIALGVFILHTLIPSIQNIYLDMNQQLPSLLKAALYVKDHLFVIGLSACVLMATSTLFFMSAPGKYLLRYALAHSHHYQLHVLSSWLTLLSECLSATISLQESILHTKQSLPQAWHTPFEKLIVSLQSGAPLSQSVAHLPSCSAFMCESIRIAEHNHSLPSTLKELASELVESLHESRSRWIALLQPALMIAVALFIAGLFVLMYQPIVRMGL